MSFTELKKIYQAKNQKFIQVSDRNKALSDLHSKASASWANGVIQGTGWVYLKRFSPVLSGATATVLVCREALIA